MSGSTYEEFLQWKEDKYNFDVQAKKDHTVIEMEPIAINRPVSDDHRHATPAESKPVSLGDPSRTKEKIDASARDASFLALAKEDSRNVEFGWRDVVLEVPLKSGGVAGMFARKTGEFKRILDGVAGYSRPGGEPFFPENARKL